MKDIRKKIKVDVYESTVTLIITDDVIKAYNNVCKTFKHFPPEEEGTIYAGLHLYHPGATGDYWVIVHRNEDIRTLAHEIFHVTHRLLHQHQVKFDIENHEAFAYLNDYLMGECYPLFWAGKDKK